MTETIKEKLEREYQEQKDKLALIRNRYEILKSDTKVAENKFKQLKKETGQLQRSLTRERNILRIKKARISSKMSSIRSFGKKHPMEALERISRIGESND
jgi:predicted nuclease with TOPRIM domain